MSHTISIAWRMNRFPRKCLNYSHLHRSMSPSLCGPRTTLPDGPMAQSIYREEKSRELHRVGWHCFLLLSERKTLRPSSYRDICERSYTNANFLAASAKINIKKAQSLQAVGFEAVVGNHLILMLDLFATESDGTVAVVTNLRAYTDYSGPVEKYPLDNELPQVNPRSGTLILWERNSVGTSTGPPRALVIPLSQGIEQLLKEFFADYLKAQR